MSKVSSSIIAFWFRLPLHFLKMKFKNLTKKNITSDNHYQGMRRDSEPVCQSCIPQYWRCLRSKSETDTEREEEVTKCEIQAAIFFPLYWYCGSLIFHLHIFLSEMGYKFKSLITMLTQKSFESLSSVLTSLVSSL